MFHHLHWLESTQIWHSRNNQLFITHLNRHLRNYLTLVFIHFRHSRVLVRLFRTLQVSKLIHYFILYLFCQLNFLFFNRNLIHYFFSLNFRFSFFFLFFNNLFVYLCILQIFRFQWIFTFFFISLWLLNILFILFIFWLLIIILILVIIRLINFIIRLL